MGTRGAGLQWVQKFSAFVPQLRFEREQLFLQCSNHGIRTSGCTELRKEIFDEVLIRRSFFPQRRKGNQIAQNALF